MFKAIKIKILKFLTKTVGQTSDGIRMSFQHGFTSGKMLDYIYANKPSGRFLIGPWIDRIYLSHPGWVAIRQRKENLMTALKEALELTLARHPSATILDVASGPGQYIIDTLKNFAGRSVRATCRDYDVRWVEEGRQKADAAGLTNVSFAPGDAFDEKSFEALRATQDVVVSSGFYDWIVDDQLIKRSMKIIFDVLRPGGSFVFTNQSGHVDLEMVENIFVDFNKEPLRMIIRPAELMNRWAAEAGFRVLRTVTDAKNYYSVSLCEKRI